MQLCARRLLWRRHHLWQPRSVCSLATAIFASAVSLPPCLAHRVQLPNACICDYGSSIDTRLLNECNLFVMPQNAAWAP